MKISRFIALIAITYLSIVICFGQQQTADFKEVKVSAEELKNWTLLGMGEASIWGAQTSLKEADTTKGVMLISPESYGENVIVRYKVLALTPATVMVVLLSLSDEEKSASFTIPEGYDGNIDLLSNVKENYFFAFKNAPHNFTPFIRRYPNTKTALASAKENNMIAGVYYNIEVGRQGAKLWLSIDGEKVFETIDENPLSGGHIAFRLRGTAGFKAGCLIKDLVIISKN